ncbi:phosphatidate cytidylyltransferase [Parvularcula dongshanensis]|uniref:Phosphatidate cytidylyltransferase n=1 Tax=Parvularcula dongshanensis TaxID=1173995 RepID=A0A840I366_9PROT|nr:phosphatidate cytidylyltransferase [Parvularcula dongshanensis]
MRLYPTPGGPIDTQLPHTPRKNRLPSTSGLGARLATAGVLIPLALLVIWFGGKAYAAVIAAMTIFLIFEWTRLVVGAEFQRGFYALSITAIVAVFLAAGGHYATALFATLTGGIAGTILEWPRRNPDSWPAVGAGYLIVPAIAALWLREVPEGGRLLTLLLFVVVWGADSGAYAVGRTLGGPKLIPKVSPNKTWSGAIGGLLSGAILAMLVAAVGQLGHWGAWALIGGALALASIVGDIAESQLKRSYGVKDSGSAFPGHGGVLDRLDGFLFAAVLLAILVLLGQNG